MAVFVLGAFERKCIHVVTETDITRSLFKDFGHQSQCNLKSVAEAVATATDLDNDSILWYKHNTTVVPVIVVGRSSSADYASRIKTTLLVNSAFPLDEIATNLKNCADQGGYRLDSNSTSATDIIYNLVKFLTLTPNYISAENSRERHDLLGAVFPDDVFRATKTLVLKPTQRRGGSLTGESQNPTKNGIDGVKTKKSRKEKFSKLTKLMMDDGSVVLSDVDADDSRSRNSVPPIHIRLRNSSFSVVQPNSYATSHPNSRPAISDENAHHASVQGQKINNDNTEDISKPASHEAAPGLVAGSVQPEIDKRGRVGQPGCSVPHKTTLRRDADSLAGAEHLNDSALAMVDHHRHDVFWIVFIVPHERGYMVQAITANASHLLEDNQTPLTKIKAMSVLGKAVPSISVKDDDGKRVAAFLLLVTSNRQEAENVCVKIKICGDKLTSKLAPELAIQSLIVLAKKYCLEGDRVFEGESDVEDEHQNSEEDQHIQLALNKNRFPVQQNGPSLKTRNSDSVEGEWNFAEKDGFQAVRRNDLFQPQRLVSYQDANVASYSGSAQIRKPDLDYVLPAEGSEDSASDVDSEKLFATATKSRIVNMASHTKLTRKHKCLYNTDIDQPFKQSPVRPTQALGVGENCFYAIMKLSISDMQQVAIADTDVHNFLTLDHLPVNLEMLDGDVGTITPLTYTFSTEDETFSCILVDKILCKSKSDALNRLRQLFSQLTGVYDQVGSLTHRVHFIRTILWEQYHWDNRNENAIASVMPCTSSETQFSRQSRTSRAGRNSHPLKAGIRDYKLELPVYAPNSKMTELHAVGKAYLSNSAGRVALGKTNVLYLNAAYICRKLLEYRKLASDFRKSDDSYRANIPQHIICDLLRGALSCHELVKFRWGHESHKVKSSAVPIDPSLKSLLTTGYLRILYYLNEYIVELNSRKADKKLFLPPLVCTESVFNHKIQKFLCDNRGKASANKNETFKDITVGSDESAEMAKLCEKYSRLRVYCKPNKNVAVPFKLLWKSLNDDDHLLKAAVLSVKSGKRVPQNYGFQNGLQAQAQAQASPNLSKVFQSSNSNVAVDSNCTNNQRKSHPELTRNFYTKHISNDSRDAGADCATLFPNKKLRIGQ